MIEHDRHKDHSSFFLHKLSLPKLSRHFLQEMCRERIIPWIHTVSVNRGIFSNVSLLH